MPLTIDRQVNGSFRFSIRWIEHIGGNGGRIHRQTAVEASGDIQRGGLRRLAKFRGDRPEQPRFCMTATKPDKASKSAHFFSDTVDRVELL